MGHLTVISNHLYKNSTEGKYAPYLKECFNKCKFFELNEFAGYDQIYFKFKKLRLGVDKEILDQWNELNTTKIADINTTNSRDLVNAQKHKFNTLWKRFILFSTEPFLTKIFKWLQN
jgi:hypothetical protein